MHDGLGDKANKKEDPRKISNTSNLLNSKNHLRIAAQDDDIGVKLFVDDEEEDRKFLRRSQLAPERIIEHDQDL